MAQQFQKYRFGPQANNNNINDQTTQIIGEMKRKKHSSFLDKLEECDLHVYVPYHRTNNQPNNVKSSGSF